MLVLSHSLLLYLSLFGFTMEPRIHRAKFQPPRGFMDAADGRKTPRRIFVPLPIPANPQTLGPMFVLQGRGANSDQTWQFSQPMSDEEMATLQKSSDNPPPRFELKYTWEYTLLLQAGPEEVRREVDVLVSDLIVRLKQLLFNSLFCAYYVGFIPMQFADVSVWEFGSTYNVLGAHIMCVYVCVLHIYTCVCVCVCFSS